MVRAEVVIALPLSRDLPLPLLHHTWHVLLRITQQRQARQLEVFSAGHPKIQPMPYVL
jgi:hypothetical protein